MSMTVCGSLSKPMLTISGEGLEAGKLIFFFVGKDHFRARKKQKWNSRQGSMALGLRAP